MDIKVPKFNRKKIISVIKREVNCEIIVEKPIEKIVELEVEIENEIEVPKVVVEEVEVERQIDQEIEVVEWKIVPNYIPKMREARIEVSKVTKDPHIVAIPVICERDYEIDTKIQVPVFGSEILEMDKEIDDEFLRDGIVNNIHKKGIYEEENGELEKEIQRLRNSQFNIKEYNLKVKKNAYLEADLYEVRSRRLAIEKDIARLQELITKKQNYQIESKIPDPEIPGLTQKLLSLLVENRTLVDKAKVY